MYNYNKVRRANAAGLLDAAARELSSYDVFLAGPYIDIALDETSPENNATLAKLLRFTLYQNLSALSHSVYLGEDVKLRTLGDANYGALSNAVTFERHYIKKHTDALVVLPSSPGSFCELGDWVSDGDICRKMLVIVDDAFKGIPSYINDGAVKFAQSNGAKVTYMDYSERDKVLTHVQEFLDFIGSVKRVDELYGRG